MTKDKAVLILENLMARPVLTVSEAQEGVVACSTVINREFVKRRLGPRPATEIDAATQAVIEQVFAELGIADHTPTAGELRHAWLVLDEQFGFAAEPDLLNHHQEVIEALLQKATTDFT